MAGKNDGKIRCSFCGKTQDQVGRMISGPNGAFTVSYTHLTLPTNREV